MHRNGGFSTYNMGIGWSIYKWVPKRSLWGGWHKPLLRHENRRQCLPDSRPLGGYVAPDRLAQTRQSQGDGRHAHFATVGLLGRAVVELGWVEKTLYLLAYVQDEAYRRHILVQLNRGEGRHALARAVFHGRKGEVRQRYREGMED